MSILWARFEVAWRGVARQCDLNYAKL